MEVSLPCFAVVAEDFEGEEGELSLTEGTDVVVVAVDDDGWWTIHTKEDIGIFPGSYLDILEEIPLPTFAEVVKGYPEMQLEVGDVVEVQDISPEGWMVDKDGVMGFCTWDHINLVSGEAGQVIDDMMKGLEEEPAGSIDQMLEDLTGVAADPTPEEPVIAAPEPDPVPVAAVVPVVAEPEPEPEPIKAVVPEPVKEPELEPKPEPEPEPEPVKEVVPVEEPEPEPKPVKAAEPVKVAEPVKEAEPVKKAAAEPLGEEAKANGDAKPAEQVPVAKKSSEDHAPIVFPKAMDRAKRQSRLSEKRVTKFKAFNAILEEQEGAGDSDRYVMPRDREGGPRYDQEGRWEFRAHEDLPPPPQFKGVEKVYQSGAMASYIDWQAKERSAVFDI
mmetsp:Transcript_7758/g.32686  ORF Transcript_7758/g.32686 Transcript_7758/m.32686 type:complete len:387 (-) Transcript_7758:122-1282(-)|eukprot:CAMPEP_0114626798 /NCGR_PEP_ID=MMETSP0168-20121206/11969_1 /TAXON_ID=95228 ORGANISM="Vannella sp., Strain DIVA3 517/6/12" /NCGR_SAMPLE_ID=MMETSP0168 /ASSEMBLY_ACC=CAM_ASM_000044 /LENGTH=386 /DNA_ID=CAMNT_0001838117 /DNA_START=75 /DNA_END=1235 /DNA_ORIENTATION=+